jgi:predicted phage terminase large subunit-like protein
MSAVMEPVCSIAEVEASLARASLLDFACYEVGEERIHHEPEPALHHRLMIEKLEAVERGEIKRLMLFLPPGSAKSTYASILFPPWYLGRNPRHSVIAGSHTAELAEHFGRKTRSIVGSAAYRSIFGFGLSEITKSVLNYELQKPEGMESSSGGDYRGVGVGGSITGRRADLIIIDDPVRGREDADSQRIRDKTWDWFRDDILTRRKPGAAIVLIQTRWHEDDLAGRILPESYLGESGPIEARNGEVWDVVCIPAEAEENDILGRAPGDWLWPEWFRPTELAAIKSEPANERSWSALYQQRPSPEQGLFFQREWVSYFDERPRNLRVYGSSDYAVTDQGGDYTVHAVFGVDPEDNIYVLDIWRAQTDSMQWVEAFCDIVLKWEPLAWAEEQGQILKGVGPFLAKRMKERDVHVARFPFASSVDKPTRAQSIRGRMAQGMVLFPTAAPWTPSLVSELLSFPAGANDDQVDCLSLIGRNLHKLQGGRVPKTPEFTFRDPTLDELFEMSDKSYDIGTRRRRRI